MALQFAQTVHASLIWCQQEPQHHRSRVNKKQALDMLRVQCCNYDIVCELGIVYKQNGKTITCPQAHGRTQWATSYQLAST